jgi:hypothetical protein
VNDIAAPQRVRTRSNIDQLMANDIASLDGSHIVANLRLVTSPLW